MATLFRRMRRLAAAAVFAIAPGAFVSAESPPAAAPVEAQLPPDTGPPTPTSVTPAQLRHIQQILNQPPGLRLDDQQLRFYLEIVARRPTFAEYARGYDFINGPTKRGNPMSHQEFVSMVTPKELYSSGGITALDQLQFAFTNWIGQSLIRKALEDLKNAKTSREALEIRERIDRELEALTTAGKGK